MTVNFFDFVILHLYFHQVTISLINLGFSELISYLKERKNRSYRGFLDFHRNVVITSLFSDDWNVLDNTWAGRFLEEAENLMLDKRDFVNLAKKMRFFILQKKGNS